MVAPNAEAIRRALDRLVEPGAVFEIRVPKAGRAGTVSGYFNDLDTSAKEAALWSGKATAVYFTVNPVKPALLARASNRMQEHAEYATADADIERRRWLYVDVDAVRPAGIAATDAEHDVALERARLLRNFLTDQGVPTDSIILADSGNGGSLYVHIDLPNAADALALVKGVLEALHGLFSDGVALVDRSVSNAARITRVPCTLNAKGDNTQDRPHRLARLLDVPDTLAVCPRDVLERIAALAPEPERPARQRGTGQPYTGPAFDFPTWLAASGLDVAQEKAWGTGMLYELTECPWNPDHKRTARIVRFENGALSAGCFHASCQGKTWADLRDVVEAMPFWTPPPSSNGQPAEDGGGVQLRRMADVVSEAVTWLWHPYIPSGKLTLLEGDPGVGKSWVALAIATAVSLGKGLPGQASGEPGNVLLASAEDGLGDTIRPRLDAMGADVSLIYAIDGPLTFDDAGFVVLESAIATVRPRLLVLDPLVAYLGGDVDIHRANEVRHITANLARLADTYGLAVLPVRHLTKGGASKPIYRGLGSIDFTAACRSVLLAGHAADNPQARGLVHIKSNLAPIGPAIGYELRGGHFYWTGESLLTAADILAADDGAGASALEEAVGFVTAQLAAGPVLATQVWGDTHDAGLKDRTVNRAKAKMGVVTHRQGSAGKRGGGGFVWHLPGDLHCQDCHIENSGNVNHSEAENRAIPAEVGNQNGVAV
ncbi:MAG: AAA family ATPase [Dehalococcoidia bacterium]|nr:AAA family ATPase [Dehalococcoidia bacterium]